MEVPQTRETRLQVILGLAQDLGWTASPQAHIWELPGTAWKLRVTGLGVMLYQTRAGHGATHQKTFETFQLRRLEEALRAIEDSYAHR